MTTKFPWNQQMKHYNPCRMTWDWTSFKIISSVTTNIFSNFCISIYMYRWTHVLSIAYQDQCPSLLIVESDVKHHQTNKPKPSYTWVISILSSFVANTLKLLKRSSSVLLLNYLQHILRCPFLENRLKASIFSLKLTFYKSNFDLTNSLIKNI